MANTKPSVSLQAAGLRNTPQRNSILRVLERAERPLAVEEIWKSMGDGRSGLPTVYRNLQRFIQEGLIESILGLDQTMRFVRCHSAHHHHHVQCEHCGRMTEIEACGVEDLLERMQTLSGYQITRHQLSLFGLCSECKQKV